MSERSASTYRMGTFSESHVLLMDRLNREHIPYEGEKWFGRGIFTNDGTMEKGWIADIFITVPFVSQLVVEIDGESHNSRHRMKLDAEKDLWFQNRGIRVLRFTNDDVKVNMDKVISKIRLEMARR
jgi:hypothetical protein